MGRNLGIALDVEKIKQLITERGFTQNSFADECGFAHAQITHVLKVGRCRATTLSIIAEALGVEAADLMPKEQPKMKIMLDPGAFMPTRAYPNDAGLDLYAQKTQIVSAKESAYFDTGVHIELPPNTAGLLLPKSGLNVKHDILNFGVIDEDYSGSIKVKLYNHSGFNYKVNTGDKISQLVIVPIVKPSLDVVDKMEERGRGNNGIGSSGY